MHDLEHKKCILYMFFNKNYVYLRHTTWFDIHIHSEMITTVKLMNTPSPHVVTFCVHVARTFSKFSVFATVWSTTVIMPCIRSLDLCIWHNCTFVHFDQHLPTSSTSPPVVTTVLFTASLYSSYLAAIYGQEDEQR